VLQRAAELAVQFKKPLVLHLRGNADIELSKVQSEAVEVIRASNMGPRHPVHLHCYTGSYEDLAAWMKAFPASRVGISSRTLEGDRGKVLARGINLENALLETDSPYLGFGDPPTNPWGLFGVAAELSRMRNLPPRVLLNLSSDAARRLYGLA
jgi:Tat protein secretion system quality control protein TatD with DNase activity